MPETPPALATRSGLMEGIYFTGGCSQRLFGLATVFLARSYFPHLLQPVTKHGGGTRTDVALFQWAPLGQGLLGGLAKLSQSSSAIRDCPLPFILHSPSHRKSLVCLILTWYVFSDTQIDTARASPDSNQAESGTSACVLSAFCVHLLISVCAQSCLTLCSPMDCSPPGSSVYGIFQARILEWVAISFSRGFS